MAAVNAGSKKEKATFTVPEEWQFDEARRLFLEPDVVDAAALPEFKARSALSFTRRPLHVR